MVSLRFKKLTTTQKEPFTQKARGVWVLVRENPFIKFLPPEKTFLGINSTDETQGLDKWPFPNTKDLFCRPCPERPRHGFVDSRKVATMEDVLTVFKQTLEVDPKAEVLVMPFIKAETSGIYIPESGVLTIGPGHDGATSGKDSITLPVIQDKTLRPGFREKAGIDKEQHVYVELVSSEGRVYVVQARSGPPVDFVTEFIPKKMQVEKVLTPSTDLLAHEALCTALAGSEGVVFWLPNSSLACHQAIHCRMNNIAYLTREEAPKIGEWIEPPKVKKYSFDLMEFQKGVRLSEQEDPKIHLPLAIGILHNVLQLEYSRYYSRLVGYSLGWIFRAGAMACLGEARHYVKKGSDSKSGALGTTSRQGVYKNAGKLANEDLCKRLATFSYKFLTDTWSSGFGGWKWFVALVQTVKLYNRISCAKYSEAVVEANKLLEMAHNGGWLFNKFIHQTIMDEAAKTPGQVMANHLHPLYGLLSNTAEIKPVLPRKYRASAKWKVTPGVYGGAYMHIKIQGVQLAPFIMTDDHKHGIEELFEEA